MRLLSVDSSGLTASVAVWSDGVILAEYTINNKKTHSQTLLPMIKQVVNDSGIALEELDAIAVSEGPGSFTGLRIGAATVKGLGLAIEKPIIPVSTLAGMAYNLFGNEGLICPIMDARRSQVYTALYRYEDGKMVTINEPAAISIEELLEDIGGLLQEGEKVTFAGDGVPVFENIITDKLGGFACFAPAHLRLQNAASVAVYASELYSEGKYVHADEFAPVYLRLSQAERERLERES